MRNSIRNIAKEIASDHNGSIQKNSDTTYGIYSKDGGWIGSLDRNGNSQGVATNYLITYDNQKGWLNEGVYA